MRRIRIKLCYDGTEFYGWQVQPDLPTIQGALQQALELIEGAPVHVAGAGRTDAGVHALGQVAAFTLRNPLPVDNLRRALNRLLPPAIRVLEAEEVPLDFHPRYHARSKTYEYRIHRGEIVSPFERLYVYHYPYPLDEQRMMKAAPLLVGTHDFSAFATADKADQLGRSKVRTIFSSELRRDGPLLIYTVRGDGFLKHMVRNIVGALLQVGRGNLSEEQLRCLVEAPRTMKAGPTVPPSGLFLVSVEY